jgi:two-component system, sensor histidine kinase PdtaS
MSSDQLPGGPDGVDPLNTLDRQHQQELVSSWGIVADFCFGDLLLFAPISIGDDGIPTTFSIVAQVRPTTSQTLYQDDLVGRVVTGNERPQLRDAVRNQHVVEGQNFALTGEGAARVTYIPVHRILKDGSKRCVAVLTRELANDVSRRPGRLERTYLEIFDALARMIVDGVYPFTPESETDGLGDAARVGDGVIAIAQDRTIAYVSPNAMSALHRIGIVVNPEGRLLRHLIPEATVVDRALESNVPAAAEVEAQPPNGQRVTIVLRAIPLLAEHVPMCAVVLLRDVSDVRRRDRMIVTKDASIREIHHRVKNNLQTISALLRLQGRRLESEEAKTAIEESVRRIRSIALVHDTLSRVERDAVPFDEIIRPLVRMVEEGLASPDRPVQFMVEGQLGDLPPETATPLVVVLTELLQNAVEHAFAERISPTRPGLVTISLRSDVDKLIVEVRDNGSGLPEGFSVSASKSLGLSIVRTLVTTELGGALAFRNEEGTVVTLQLPRVADPRTRYS